MKDHPDTPFNRPSMRGKELEYIREALDGGHFAARGHFTSRVEQLLEQLLGAPKVFLTNSCTAALEIAALLTVQPGDEVILPSFTYATTASAFARCGATLVFVDISPDTLNIDPRAVTAALTERTRAIVGVHYSGVACDVQALRKLADSRNMAFIEDAAHGFGATSGGRALGTFGDLAAFSFHETKNVISGEGGALVVNRAQLVDRAEIILDRGTDRAQFLRGKRSEYSWKELGSAFAPSEIIAAFLLAQIEDVDGITSERRRKWNRYHRAFAALDLGTVVRRPTLQADTGHNGHVYYLMLSDASLRPALLAKLAESGVHAAFHYVPLHNSEAGRKFGRAHGSLAITESVANRIVRLPLYQSMSDGEQDRVIESVLESIG